MARRDPRALRSDDALAATIHRLAADTAVEQLGIDEVCTAAGVSRATFYRRARTPGEVLVRVLERELADQRRGFGERAAEGGANQLETHRMYNLQLAEHVAAHADVYRNSLSMPQSVLRELLRAHISDAIRGYVDRHRLDIVLPRPLADAPSQLAREVLAQHYAAGNIALIEVWVQQADERRDPHDLKEWLMSFAPSWDRRLMDLGGGRNV